MEIHPTTKSLVRFSSECYRANLSDALHDKIKSLIFDQIGLQIGCAELPWSRTVYRYHSETFPVHGHSTIAYYGDRVSPEQAAFTNACFGHAQDFDDTCLKVQTHPGAVIIPVAIAMGEQTGASGLQVMKAIAAGMEVALRIAHSVSPGCLQRGHHTPQAVGPYGSALTAGLLMGLDDEQLLNAMGIAGSFSGGLIEYTQSGGSVKRIHTAIPTTAGIRAAYFAADGMTGPATVLEGKKGFCAVYSDTTDLSRLTDRLYERYLIHEVALKYYNCCYFIHAPLEATLQLTQEHGLTPDRIQKIRVGTSKHGTVHVGRIAVPHDSLGAQFSVQFTLALALLKEIPGLESYEEHLWCSDVRNYATRVEVFEDPTCTAEYPENWGSLVHIDTHDGKTFSKRVRFPIGNPENPMSDAQVHSKFMRNVEGRLTPLQAKSLYARIDSLASLADIRDLTELFVAQEPPGRAAQHVRSLHRPFRWAARLSVGVERDGAVASATTLNVSEAGCGIRSRGLSLREGDEVTLEVARGPLRVTSRAVVCWCQPDDEGQRTVGLRVLEDVREGAGWRGLVADVVRSGARAA
jgi:2-methylcitrate dehydratase PrpD